MTNETKHVGVIGAGPAGLTSAYELAKQGIKVEVFERSNAVGGMAKSLKLWDQTVDLGPHRFFSTDPRVNAIWLEIAGDRYDMVDRLTRIYYKNTFFDYPLKVQNVLNGIGISEATRCVISYLKAKFHPETDETTFENWVISRFGQRLFEIFFKSYSEKLWGISCQQLDADFAAQRIKKFSLFEAGMSMLVHGKTKHKTLVDQFAFPFQGTGSIYEKMAGRIREMGGTVHLNETVLRVCVDNSDPIVELESGKRITFSHVVSSMPIIDLVKGLNPPDDVRACLSHLGFRNTILVYLEIEGSDLFPDQWIYIHSPDLKTGRITNFRVWLPSLYGISPNTILCLEYWCFDHEELWTKNASFLIQLASQEIRATGLIGYRRIHNACAVKLSKCYPVYTRGYKEYLKPVISYLAQSKRLSVIGRYGAFKYNNQDHSILMGLLAAQNIAANAGHDLWKINTDYEYQESSLITKSGLQKV